VRFATLAVAVLITSYSQALAVHGGAFQPPGVLVVGPAVGAGPGRGGGGAAGPGAGRPTGAGSSAPMPGGPARPVPASPPGGNPLAPGILPNPYTIGGVEVRDVLDWRLWWEFNRDRYLSLSKVLARTSRGGDDFFLGAGQRDRPRERVAARVVDGQVLPALMTAIASGGDLTLTRDTILAAAKASAARNPMGFDVSLRHFLAKNPDIQIKRGAAVSLGVLNRERAVEYELLPILRDDSSGRRTCAQDPVDPSLRCFAAYGLALLAGQSGDDPTRLAAARGLAEVAGDAEAPDDVRASAFFALGFVPLGVDGTVRKEEPAELKVPLRDLGEQVEFVLRHFLDGKLDTVVRAQAAGALGRLLAYGQAGLPDSLRVTVIDVLARARMRDRRQPHPVRENAVLALTMIGDADGDLADQWVHYSLRKSFWTGGPLEKRFALIGMGQVAAKPGRGEGEAFAATGLLRGILLHHMSVGRRETRTWAALGLGLLGHGLRTHGQTPDPEVDLALRAAIHNHRKGENLGAYALAAGLRRDAGAVQPLLDQLTRTRDPEARAYIALALGMIGDSDGKPALRTLLLDEEEAMVTRSEAGLALGLLGDSEVIGALVTLFKAEEATPDSRLAAATALGLVGDDRALLLLADVFRDGKAPTGLRRVIAMGLGRLCDPAPLPWRAVLSEGTDYNGAPATLTNPEGTGVLDLR
jgi:HEAT repeat protein